MSNLPEELVNTIREADRFVLLTHTHPDGDALGSLLGLGTILEGMGKKVLRYLEEPVSRLYSFLPGCELIETDFAALSNFISEEEQGVAAIALDCGDCDRLGDSKKDFLEMHPFLVLDHHRGHTSFGDLTWLDFERSSTGEMVYELAMELAAPISYESAFNLYVAITTDTGSFRYENTSPRTLRIAAELQELGVRPEEVADLVYDNFTLQRLRLMEQVLATLVLYEDDQLALIKVTHAMIEDSGAEGADLEGFINYPRALQTVKVAIFIKEIVAGNVSVSLRAKGECDVAKIAASFGGGGHRNAAGFHFRGKTVDQVQDEVLVSLKEALA